MVIVAVFIIVMQARENRHLKENLPYLLPDESINYFELLSIDNERIDVNALSTKPSIIFIFKSPCNTCNRNIQFWRKIAKIMEGKINIFGIVFSGYNQMVEFSDQSSINFKLYTPVDPQKFRHHLKLKLNIAQTIVYHKGSVQLLKMGELNGEDYLALLKYIKSIARRSET